MDIGCRNSALVRRHGSRTACWNSSPSSFQKLFEGQNVALGWSFSTGNRSYWALRNLISELRASYYYWAFGKQRLMKIKTLVLMWRYFERRRLLKTCCYQKLVVARSLFGTQCNTLLENPICNIYSQFHDNLIFRGNVDERAYREISQLQNQHHFFLLWHIVFWHVFSTNIPLIGVVRLWSASIFSVKFNSATLF